MPRSRPAFESSSDGGSIATAVLGALNHEDRGVRVEAIEEASRVADPDDLIDAVADQGDALRRNAAIEALSLGTKRSVPSLIRALAHDDPEVVMFAAHILGKTRDSTAVPHLLRLLQHEDINVAQAAVESLSLLRASEAVDDIVALLESDPWLRFAAVHALGDIGDQRAAPALIELLDDDAIRDLAVAALGKIRSGEALRHLAELLYRAEETDTFFVCLRAVASVLERYTDTSELADIDSWNRLASPGAATVHLRILDVLSGDEPESVGAEDRDTKIAAITLIRALGIQSLYTPMVLAGRDPRLLEPLEFCAVSVGADIAESLRVALSYSNRNVRLLACKCAGALRLQTLSSRIGDLLGDEDPEVRRSAARALAHMGNGESAHVLAPLLLDPSEEVSRAVHGALCHMDAESVTAALLDHTGRDADYRLAALRVMEAAPHPDQLGFILDCLSATSPEIRKLAIAAVAAQPGFDFIDAIEPFLSDPDASVRSAVIQVLSRRPCRRVRQLLLAHISRDSETREAAVRAAAELDDPLVAPHLIELYHRESGATRLAIVEVLSVLREPAAEPLVVRLLSDDDGDVRRRAVRALSRFETDTALRHLIAAARDSSWRVRAAVTEALCESDADAALEELERLCLDENHYIATLARHRLEAAE